MFVIEFVDKKFVVVNSVNKFVFGEIVCMCVVFINVIDCYGY